MKKLVLTLVLTGVAVTASFHAQVKHLIHPEELVRKDITVQVCPSAAYSQSAAYRLCAARLTFTVARVRGNELKVLWQNEYPQLALRQLGGVSPSFTQNIHIEEVLDKKEQIVVMYTITYSAKGSVLEVQNHQLIARGKAPQTVSIPI